MNVTIWHNPSCSKSRQTLNLLRENGIDPGIRLYLKNPPSRGELEQVQAQLGLAAIEFTRTGEQAFKDAGLSKTSSDAAIFAAMATHPKLIERPIVVVDGKAAIGRPPESVLSLLDR